MKRSIFLLLLSPLFLFSCTSDDDVVSPIDSSITPPVITHPVQKVSFKYADSFKVINAHYYKGPDGRDYASEADAFLLSQWGNYYETTNIHSIDLEEDYLVIRENNNVKRLKFSLENNLIYADYFGKKILFGYFNDSKSILKLYKNYQSYGIVEKERGATYWGQVSEYGKVGYDNFFPLLTSKPTDLTFNSEFIFWSTIEYTFVR